MGVHDNAACLRLSEDFGQAHNREHLRFDEIPQDISGSYRRKLVNVPDKDHAHFIRDRLQEIIHQHQVDHGAFVQDQHIALKRILRIALVALRRLDLQEPVDRLGLHAGGLRHVLGCSARGRCQDNIRVCRLKRLDDAESRRCFACAGAARQDQDLTVRRGLNGAHLHLVILHPGALRDPLGKTLGLHPDAARGMGNFRKASRRANLGEIEDREIDRRAFLIGERFRPQILVADHLLQSV